MINKHELLGFECLESRHTFAVEDVALIEFTTTDGRSGHFWYDSYVDPSPYENAVIHESPNAWPFDPYFDVSGLYSSTTSMGPIQLTGGSFQVDTDVDFVFDNYEFTNASIGIRHELVFDMGAWKTMVSEQTFSVYGDVREQDAYWLMSFNTWGVDYLSDVFSREVFPNSLPAIDFFPEFGRVSKELKWEGQQLDEVLLAAVNKAAVLDLSLLNSGRDHSNLFVTAYARDVDPRVTVNDFHPHDDVRFYWSSNETTTGIISEVPSEIFGQSAVTRYSTTFSASIDSIQTLIPSNANSIIAIIDNNDNILEKNEFNNVLAVPLSEFLVDDGSVQLSYDSFGRLYADGQPVRIQNQYAASAIGGFEVVSATDEGGNQLIVENNGTQYRLIADDVWRINGLFDSLQNESTAILDLSARESSSTLNIAVVAGAYEINGVNNPTLVVRRGQTYTFNLNTAGHPFWLQTTGNGHQEANSYSDGFTGNSQTTGEHQWVVPEDAPDEIFYQCEFHPVMFGKIIVVD